MQTRQAILEAAGAEFSLSGYSGTALGAIVARTGLTKGALFHHFPDKRNLAVTWVRENLTSAMTAAWLRPLESLGSLDDLKNFGRTCCLDLKPGDAASALVAMAAEMASNDAILAEALHGVFENWRSAFETLLERGKNEDWIHRSIRPGEEAAFLVSAFAGFTVTTQCNPRDSIRRSCATSLEAYLETLRAQ